MDLDGVRVSGLCDEPGNRHDWHCSSGPDPRFFEYEHGFALCVVELAWQLGDVRSWPLLERIRAYFAPELPHDPVLEVAHGDVKIARILTPITPEQRAAIRDWVATLPDACRLVIDLTRWSTKELGSAEWLAAMSRRPAIAFVVRPTDRDQLGTAGIPASRIFDDTNSARVALL